MAFRSTCLVNDRLASHARWMRRNPTDAERRLWQAIRRQAIYGFRFRRQRPIGSYIVDLVCLEAGLVIEVDGAHHFEQPDYDRRRDAWLESEGFRVMRFSDRDVLTGLVGVREAIGASLAVAPPPELSPLKGEGAGRTPDGRSRRGGQ